MRGTTNALAPRICIAVHSIQTIPSLEYHTISMCLDLDLCLFSLFYQTLFEFDQLLIALVIKGSDVVFFERGKIKPSVSKVILKLYASRVVEFRGLVRGLIEGITKYPLYVGLGIGAYDRSDDC